MWQIQYSAISILKFIKIILLKINNKRLFSVIIRYLLKARPLFFTQRELLTVNSRIKTEFNYKLDF